MDVKFELLVLKTVHYQHIDIVLIISVVTPVS